MNKIDNHISVELNESVLNRLMELGNQKSKIDTIIEATMITVFEQAGHKVPLGCNMILEGNKISYFVNDNTNTK